MLSCLITNIQHVCDIVEYPQICSKMGWPHEYPNFGIGWGHLTSTDLAHWVEQPVALVPPFVDIAANLTQAQTNYPNKISSGYFTGSAQILNGTPSLLFPAVFRGPAVETEFPNCTIGNKSFPWTDPGKPDDSPCFFDLQLAVPTNLSDP